MPAPVRGRIAYSSGRPGRLAVTIRHAATTSGARTPDSRATERLPVRTAGVVPARKARFILTTTADHVRTATSTDSGTPHRRPTLVIVLGLLAALGPFTIDLYLPALPEITGDLHTSGSAVQLTLTGTLVGLAVGQLIVGPLSDVLGRRRPLLAGIGVHVAASLLCAASSGVLMLGTLRVLQGFGAAAAAVIAIAVVRDCFTGHRAAAVLSRLMLVVGVSPLLAPTVGGELLRWTDWRGVFLALSVIGAAVALIA